MSESTPFVITDLKDWMPPSGEPVNEAAAAAYWKAADAAAEPSLKDMMKAMAANLELLSTNVDFITENTADLKPATVLASEDPKLPQTAEYVNAKALKFADHLEKGAALRREQKKEIAKILRMLVERK